MTKATQTSRRRIARTVVVAVACGAACALVAGVAVWLWWPARPAAETGAHDVPLGVEEAVIIRYDGPRLAARPYRRGASLNLRIAQEAHGGETAIYDVRYVVTLPGEFDLKDYLESADGAAIDDLPSFKVRGLTSLTKDLETRIQEIEEVHVEIWHWYYETLAALGVAWVLWLCGLIWIGRPKRPPKPVALPPEPSLAEQIARYFAALGRGQLSVAEKARLEILLIRHWRERLDLHQHRMAAACRHMRRDAVVGRAYDALQAWLHAPAATVEAGEIVQLCTPLLGEG